LRNEVDQVVVEHEPQDACECRDHDVSHGGREVRAEIAPCNSPDVAHVVAPWSVAGSEVVSCRKISSRLTRSAENSRTPILLLTAVSTICSRASELPGAISTTTLVPTAVTLFTPGTFLIASTPSEEALRTLRL